MLHNSCERADLGKRDRNSPADTKISKEITEVEFWGWEEGSGEEVKVFSLFVLFLAVLFLLPIYYWQ